MDGITLNLIKMNNNFKIIFIAGNGRSGSTLLDILLGSSANAFGGGELTNISRDTIFDEFCSCQSKIGNCELWTTVYKTWLENSNITLEKYKFLKYKFERNKSTLRVLVNYIFPTKDFKNYRESTYQLFSAIHKVTGKNIIIDSSKSPQRILILKKYQNLTVFHLCRNARGVLNSAKKVARKDVKAGIEENQYARRTSKTLIEWVFVNFITELFCIRVNSKKIKFKEFTSSPEILNQINSDLQIKVFDNLNPPHMLAGNRLRLQKNINLEPKIGGAFKNLTKQQLRVAQAIEFLFPYWC